MEISETAASIESAPVFSAPTETAAPISTPAAVGTVPTETPSTETAASEPQNVRDYLTQGLNDIYGTPAAEPVEEPATVAETIQTTDPAPEIQTATETPPEPSTTEQIPDIITELPTILTAEEIDKQFERAPKAIRDLTKSYADEARASRETVEKLGGTHFLEPMARIAEGIKSGENMGVFEGFLAATGVNGFTGLLDDALNLALVHIAQGEPTTEGEKVLKEQTTALVDKALQARFGENATLSRIAELCKYDQDGYLNVDDVRKYYEESDQSENPVVTAQKAEIERLKTELGQKDVSETEAKRTQEKQVFEQFTASANKSLDAVLDKHVFGKSVINPLPNDPAPIKTGKEAAKQLLNSFIQQKMSTDTKYADLKKSYARGEANTAKYQNAFSSLIETAMIEAREMASSLEGLFTATVPRNNLLLNDTPKTPPGEPTQTTAANPAVMSQEEYRVWLGKQIAAATSG